MSKGDNTLRSNNIGGIDDRPPEARARYRLKNRTASAGQVLARVLRYTGLQEKLNKYQFVQYWPQIVGKGIASKAKPQAIRNGILLVRVENSSWAQELSFQRNIIKSRLNAFLGAENAVRDIHFFVHSEDELAKRRGYSYSTAKK